MDLKDPATLDYDEKTRLSRARERCPHLAALARHVTEFAKILTGLRGDQQWPGTTWPQSPPADVPAPIVRALCAQRPKNTKPGPSPRSAILEKALARERRLGDLNPGWAQAQTALAVRRHRPD
jgi:hypothetical protein